MSTYSIKFLFLAYLDIKAENLAEIITTSTADFLIVIGDRNMKNRSCQAKRSGKLVEMNVSCDSTLFLLKDQIYNCSLIAPDIG